MIDLLAILIATGLGLMVSLPLCAPGLRLPGVARGRLIGELLLAAGIAFPVGAGLLSLAHFALLPLGAAGTWLALAVAMAIALAANFWVRRIAPANLSLTPISPATEAVFPLRWVLALLSGGALLAVLVSMGQILSQTPNGGWDSWSIWTLRARFLAGGDAYWRNAFDAGFRLSHPEYPVMTSSLLAWGWNLTGSQAMLLPHAVAISYLLSAVGAVAGLLTLLRGPSQAMLAVPALLSPVVVVTVSAALYADMPLGAILVCAAAMFVASLEAPQGAPLAALAGLLAALCWWTKVEGLIALGALAAAMFVVTLLTRRQQRAALSRLIAFVAGAAPAVACAAVVKWLLAPSSAVATANTDAAALDNRGRMLANAFDFSRYVEVARGTWEVVSNLGSWWFHPLLFLLLAVLLLGIASNAWRRLPFLIGSAAWLTITGGYLAIYLLVTPGPYSRMMNSFDRLILHLWPMLVLMLFLLLRSPEDWAQEAPERASRKQRKHDTAKIKRSRAA